MPQLIFPDIQGSYNAGVAQGRQNAFLNAAGQAVTAPSDQRQGLIAQAAQADPVRALTLNNQLTQQDDLAEDRRNATLVNMSKLLVSAPEQYKDQVYQQIKPSLARLGLSQIPENYDDTVAQTAQSIVSAYQKTPTSSGLAEFQGQAAAAGLKPGTPEYENAAKIALGVNPRAVTGAAKTGVITGADGRQRPFTFDPSTQSYRVFDGQQWVPLGAQDAAQIESGGAAQPSTPARKSIDQIMAEATQVANQGGPGANAQQGQAYLMQQMAANGYQVGGQGGGSANLGVGRAPEDQAFATESAQQAAQLQALPAQENIKTQAAIQQAGGVAQAQAQAKNQAEQAQTLQQRQADARKTLSDLDEAEKLLPQTRGGSLGAAYDSAAATFGHSTDSAKAASQLDIIAGRLTSSVPRMQGPQSDRDVQLYQQQAGDLANRNLPVETRLAAARELRRLQNKYMSDPYGNGAVMPTGNQIQTNSVVAPAPSQWKGFSIQRID